MIPTIIGYMVTTIDRRLELMSGQPGKGNVDQDQIKGYSRVDALNRLLFGAGGMAVVGAAGHVPGTPLLVPLLAGSLTGLSFVLPAVFNRKMENEHVASAHNMKFADRNRMNQIDFALKTVTSVGGFIAGTFVPSEHWDLVAAGTAVAFAGYGLTSVNRRVATRHGFQGPVRF